MADRYKLVTDLADTVTAVKTSAGALVRVVGHNASGATAYVQVFDLATGSVTLGSTEPLFQFAVADNGNLNEPIGAGMSTAISIASTTAATGSSGSSAGVDVTVIYE